MKSWSCFLILLSLLAPNFLLAKTVRYDLEATSTKVNLSGNAEVDFAILINGQIPAPTLEFTEGDDAEIIVKNSLPQDEISIHWHGILLPPEMDGVPYLTTPPIKPGTSHTFKFKIRQSGTYWYHSHTGLQEQKGVFGAFVIQPKKKSIKVDREMVLVLSDWTDENPDQVIKNLKKDGDYYVYKKNNIRSWSGAIEAGKFGNLMSNESQRMAGMDLSDVGYDAFLINGKRELKFSDVKPGQTIRLRIINAAASTYFYVSLADQKMRVVSADGQDIKPVEAQELILGMAETYDVVFTMPKEKSLEFRATAQDVTGTASAWFGEGSLVYAPDKPKPDLYEAMAMSADGGGHAHHDHAMMNALTVEQYQSEKSTAFATPITQDLKLVLSGDMSRYVWFINGKPIHEEQNLFVKTGDVVRISFFNETMMHHPMHLHGHFFRVVNKASEYSPLKHTVDVPPHGSRIIEFKADEPGQWMLHCHNLYHMKSGMARVINYLEFKPSAEIEMHQKHDPHGHQHIYYSGEVELSSGHAQAHGRAKWTRDEVEVRAEVRDYEEADQIEGDLTYRRWLDNYLNIFAGATHVPEFEDTPNRATIGVSYIFPYLIEASGLADSQGDFRFDLSKRFQWTTDLFSELDVSFRSKLKTEFEFSLMYAHQWAWSGGLMITDESVGLGFVYKF